MRCSSRMWGFCPNGTKQIFWNIERTSVSRTTAAAPATSVIVAPGGAYKFVSVPGKLEADSVPMSHNAPFTLSL